MTKMVTVTFESTAPYSQSRMHDTPKLPKELADAYEQRTWREKCNVNEAGEIVVPAMAFKQALDTVARRLGETIPGKGKATFTKHFVGGVLCAADLNTGVNKDDVPAVTINANSDGVRGSGKRVKRTFPQITKWSGQTQFMIVDDTVTKDLFERYITEAGKFIGVGRFRPENGGMNGRFKPTKFEWIDEA